MSTPAIRVENLGKRYRLGLTHAGSIRELASRATDRLLGRKPSLLLHEVARVIGDGQQVDENGHFWALKDISFEVQPGEVMGIIGRNGAGKSTLLKILSRITAPTQGRVEINGRVASLLEVGTGFHPELTGCENVYLNGAILGMTKAEIRRKFDEIVAFAEIEKFIDTPVKRYSSGMYVRLAFAVAAHLEPEIMIVDEVLAVGDTTFQEKCLKKLGEVSSGGRTVLFVSHNLAAVQNLCQRVVLMIGGKKYGDGSPAKILPLYARCETAGANWQRPASRGQKPLQIDSATVSVDHEQRYLDVAMELTSTGPHKPAFVAVDIVSLTGTPIMQAIPSITPPIHSERQWHNLSIAVDLPPLIPGRYLLNLWVGSHNTQTLDYVERQVGFEVVESPTPGRTFPHTSDHGYIVPPSRAQYRHKSPCKPA